MEDVSKEQILLGRHELNHNESTQKVYGVKQQQKSSQNHLDFDIALVKTVEDMTETCHCPLCLLAQDRQLSFLGRVLLGNCRGDTTGVWALLVFQGQEGLVLFFLLNPSTLRTII